jgi:Undecaprenyl-phosphate glucose phosphotransferase
MQHCSLTISGQFGNTFLTTAAISRFRPLQPVHFLQDVWDKVTVVSKESQTMRQDALNRAQVISSDALAKLAEENPQAEALIEAPELISRSVIEGLVRLLETMVILAIGTGIWFFYVADTSAESVLRFLPVAGFVTIAIFLAMHISGLFKIASLLHVMQSIPKIAMIWAGVFALVFAFVFFTKIGANYSRGWLGGWAIGGFLSLLLGRVLLAELLKSRNKKGQLSRRAVLVGGGEPAKDLLKAYEASPASDVSIIGIFDDRGDDRSPPKIRNLRKLGTVDELVQFARNTRVDMLIITLPLIAENRLLQVLKRLWVLPVDIRLSAYSQKLRYKSRAYSYVGNIPLLDVFDKPLSGWNALLKNVEDKVIAAIAVVVFAPVMALVALAVKLDSRGPVFFKQKRYGFNNELIEVYKFRSMYVDQCDATATKLVTRGDPRVTRVGRFIRKTSLDELPQIFNVLAGQLSLVGPRPHATHAKAKNHLYTDVVDGYFARHRVKPGITGWAQINGWRGETDTEEKIQRRVEHDLFYIENWSLLFDLYIMAKTPFSIIETDNAY